MKKILLALILIITSTSCFAVIDREKITIKEAVEIASKNNLDIQASRMNLQIAENNIKSANSLQNPSIGAQFEMGKAGKGNPQQIGVMQTIELGKRGPRKDLAKANKELTKRDIEYLENDLRMDVREAYTNLLAKKAVLTTRIQQEEILKGMLDFAKQKHSKNNRHSIDVLQAQLEINQVTTEVNSAKYDVKTALYEFNKVINCPDGFYDTIADNFTSEYRPLSMPKPTAQMPNFDEISNQAMNNRFDIKIALQQIEVAEKELLVELRKKVPDFELIGGYSYQSRGMSDDGTFKNGAFVGVNFINIPLFYTHKPEIKNAKLRLEQAHLNYASVENKAENDLKKAYEKFLTAQINLNYYNETLLASSEELIKESRKRYKEGKIDLTTLITMEESYRMIIIAHTYALADYYNAWNYFIREVNNENFKVTEETEEV
ncbi:MAG: TolC family protein [Candidatus Gastranaerophilales bacterium]|nr:TolC family protein [Candidatus Gastranaerophilales bacterium]